MKRLIMILIIVLLAGCDNSVNELVDENIETSEDQVVSYTSTENELIEIEEQQENDAKTDAHVETEEIVTKYKSAVIVGAMPSNAYNEILNLFNDEVDWFTGFDIDALKDYESLYFFYDDVLEPKLVSAGFVWPQLEPYEMIKVIEGDQEYVFVNFKEADLRRIAVTNFVTQYENIGTETLLLVEQIEISPEKVSTDLADACLVPHDNRLRNDYYEMVMGFPRPPRRLPNDRDITALVLFVEFENYPASRPVEDLNKFFNDRYVKITNDYLLAMSYGRVQHSFYYYEETIKMPTLSEPIFDPESFVRDALRKADLNVDFTDYDYVVFHVDPTLPLDVASFAWVSTPREGDGFVTDEKTFYGMTAWSGETVRPNLEWVGVHEIMHLYGLVDYYSRPENVWRGDEWVGSFDMMSRAMGNNKELLLWSRYYIGWVTPEEVSCIDARESIENIELIINSTMNDEGIKGAIIRLSQFELILIERKDSNEYCKSCRGGLIVTKYDASIPAMYGPLRIVRPEGSVDPDYEDAFLYQGDSVETGDLIISVIQEGRNETLISISQKNQ